MTAKQYGPWQVQETKIMYQSNFITVREDQVIKPDNKPGTYATVQMKHGVAVLPIDAAGDVYLVRQFRYSIGQESIEVISGGLEENEEPLKSAQREAHEEAGIWAEKWTEVGRIDLDTSIVQAPVYLFLAEKLQFKEPQREGTEQMELLKVPFREALRMVQESIITHSPSCVLILKAQSRLTT